MKRFTTDCCAATLFFNVVVSGDYFVKQMQVIGNNLKRPTNGLPNRIRGIRKASIYGK